METTPQSLQRNQIQCWTLAGGLIENSQNSVALTFCFTLLWLEQSERRDSAREERDERLHLPVCLLLFFLLSLCQWPLPSLAAHNHVSQHYGLSCVFFIFSLPVFRWIRLQEDVWMLEQLRPEARAAWKHWRSLLHCWMTAGLDVSGVTLITTCRYT